MCKNINDVKINTYGWYLRVIKIIDIFYSISFAFQYIIIKITQFIWICIL